MLIRVAIERPRLQGQNMKATAVEELRQGIRRNRRLANVSADRIQHRISKCHTYFLFQAGKGNLVSGSFLTPRDGHGKML